MRQVIALIILLFFISCNKRTHESIIIDQANELVYGNPDSSLNLLQKNIEEELLIDSLKAKYWLVVGQAHYNTRKSMSEDSLILYSFNYYNNIQPIDTRKLLQSYKLAANYFWWNDKKEKAREYLHKGIELGLNANDTISSIHLLKSMANNAMQEDSLENYIIYIKKLIELDYRATDLYTYHNELGIMYYYMHEKDSSLYYMEKALNTINSSDSTLIYNYIARNYADILSDFGLHDRAIMMQKKVLDHYIQTKNKYESLSYMSLSRYYLNIDMKDSALYYMQLAENTHLPYIDDDLSLSNYYTIQKTILDYVMTGAFTIRLTTSFSNRMYDTYSDRGKIIEGKSESQRLLEVRNMNLRLSKQRNHFLFILIALLLLIATFIIGVYTKKRRKMLYEKEEELEALKKLVSDSEKTNNNDEGFFKKILLQQLGIIKLAATNPTSQNQEFMKQMQRITNRNTPVDALLNWDDLYAVINTIYDNYYTKVYDICKNTMIDKEFQLCCLLKAEFSTKEISVITQQSIRTIYQRKSTIRQKLRMNEKEDITEHLNSLIS